MKDAKRDFLDVGWEEEPPGPAYVFGMLRRQILVLLFVPVAVVTLVMAYLITVDPLYTATASIYVKLDDPAQTDMSPLDTHVALIQSNPITSAVIQDLGLDQDYEPVQGRLKQMIVRARGWLELEVADELSDFDTESYINRLVQSALSVERVGNTTIIDVRYTSFHRVDAVEMANAFASTYVNDVSQAANRAAVRRTQALQARAAEVKKLAMAAEDEAQRLMSAHDFMATGEQDLEGRIAQFREQLSTLNASEAEASAKLALLSQPDKADILQAAALQTDETLEIYRDMVNASNNLSQLRNQPRVSADTIERLEESIAGMRASLERAVGRVRDEIDLELAVIAARRSSILDEMNQIFDYGRSAAWSRLLAAQRQAEVYDGIYQVYLNELENENRRSSDSGVRLVSEARPPVDPSFPKYKVALVFAAAIGLAFAGGVAMYREWARSQSRRRRRPAGYVMREPF